MRRALLALVAAGACTPPPPPPIDAVTHAAQVEAWQERRYAGLMQEDGWLSLVGLFWLEPGPSTLGADSASDLWYVSPSGRFPGHAGTFELHQDTVWFRAAPGIDVRAGEEAVTRITLVPGDSSVPRLRLGSVQWTVIRRGGRMAVRMWDAESPVRTGFAGIGMYPLASGLRVPARFIARDPPDTIDVPNILGGTNRTPSPASVRFELDGRRYTLDLWKDSDDPVNFFTAFADATNGAGTYGGGRFLWIDAPGEDGWTIVDFNRAYNPPCVFTEFATCPLPPGENRLPIAIEAGEKDWKD